jgi:hypothetical protein
MKQIVASLSVNALRAPQPFAVGFRSGHGNWMPWEDDVPSIKALSPASLVLLAALAVSGSAPALAAPVASATHIHLTERPEACGSGEFRLMDIGCQKMEPQLPIFEGQPDAQRHPYYFQGDGKDRLRGPLYGEARP